MHGQGLHRRIAPNNLLKITHKAATMPMSPVMLQFVEDELILAPALIARTVAAILQQPTQAGMAPNTADRSAQQGLIDTLRKHSATFEQTFVDQLRARVMADMQDLAHPAGTSPLMGDLQLMDEARVEADIEISRTAQLIDSAAEWERRELQTFTSTLMGQEHVGADSNPLRPAAYAHALWEACSAIPLTTTQRNLLLRAASDAMAAQLKMAWAAACTRLESQGVTPSVYRTMVVGTVAAAAAAPAPSTPRAFEQALQQISDALHARTARAPHAPPAMPVSTALRAFDLAGAQNVGAPDGMDPHVVALLSRIFEAVLSDDQLPTVLRPVMARLQTSVLRLYLVDRTLLDNPRHPVWSLMNRIAQAVQLWPQPGDPRTARLSACCESLVSEIAAAQPQSAQTFSKALARLEAHLNQELQAQQARASKSTASLAAREQREALERGVSAQLTDQAQPLRLSPRLREFVTQDWARVISESTLRHGNADDRTTSALKTADDLLWSLHIPDHPQSRQRLLGLLPDLLKRVRAGMTLVAMPQAQQQAVLDELMVVHTESLRPGERPSTREPTPQEIFQRLRDEGTPSSANPSATAFADSLIEISSMDTVPAELIDDINPARADADRQLDAMAPGVSCRWFLSGSWRNVQLLWRSDAMTYCVFAGESDGRTHAITRQALIRLINKGLLKPCADTPLIQRAIARVMRDLSASP